MTKQEAIWYLEPIAASASLERYKEALTMALDALREKQERENPKRLTEAELLRLAGPVWCQCKPLEGGTGFWCLCHKGYIIAPSGQTFHIKDIPHWRLFKHKPKEGEADGGRASV